jgi:hypothetical protein
VSDDTTTLIPVDPQHVPSADRLKRAFARFKKVAKLAKLHSAVELLVNDTPMFFHAGANWNGTVKCPSCGAEADSTDWWDELVQRDSLGEEAPSDSECMALGGSFKLEKYPIPCCGAEHTLNELIYDWPQGFARCALTGMNMGSARFTKNEGNIIGELEGLLGTKLRLIITHV